MGETLQRAAALARRHGDIAQNRRVAQRRNGKAMVVIPGAEAAVAGIEAQADLALLEDDAVLVAEHREQHLAGEVGTVRLPFEFEEHGLRRPPAPFEEREP